MQSDHPNKRDPEPGASSDRNLLYAIMALRVGFIQPDQMIAALHSWVDSKREPIENVLIKLGFITEENCNLLTPLVEAFIHRHGGEVDRGLAALTPLGGLRDELAELNDHDISGSLKHLRDTVEDSELTSTWTPKQERFRILSFHRQGGLGKVSVALDNELNRQVAFKEIRDEYANSQSARERFLLEAEVTGRLEHPGIVPVYGLGHFPDGRPFYAMRFIRGDTFKSSIGQFHNKEHESPVHRRSDFRRLLERFLDVCEAVDYAHARGVLHRDLKPGNIMLGRYGETLVVDWGLAKAFDRERTKEKSEEDTLRPRLDSSAASMQGVAIGSPAYMSPEQANGQLDELGPQTDVFGLGATLYCLLTGQAPYCGDADYDTLEQAKRGHFRSPQELREKVPTRLAKICLKAMALRKEERHQTAAELREEIWQWLMDEPISALLAAVEHFEELVANQPNVPQFKIRHARELSNLSKVYQSLERSQEAIQAAKRSVALLDATYANDPLNLSLFQELYFSRAQLSSALRANGLSDDAQQVEKTNQEQFLYLLKSVPQRESIRDALFELTLHQGFSTEEAEKLLKAHAEEVDNNERRPTGIHDENAHTLFVTDEPIPAEMPRHIDLENRYSLISVLGEGWLGVVYRATDNLVPREVAIKICRPTLREYASYLLRESAIMALLDHPNLIPFHDAGYREHSNDPFLVMKFIEGTDLTRARGQIEFVTFQRDERWFRMLRSFADVCDAVDHAHGLGIVHGDPKPSNIIVDNRNRLWLFDWGLSRVVDADRLKQISHNALSSIPEELRSVLFEKQEPGTIVGTPAYMSPEQASGEGISQRTDIYVLGASFYFLITGQPPWFSSDINEGFEKHFERIRSGSFRRPREIDKKIPRSLEQVCLRAMETRREERFASAAELASALRSVLR